MRLLQCALNSFAIFITAASVFGQPPAPIGLVTGVTTGTQRNDFSGKLGMRFRAGNEPVVITKLGRMMLNGDNASHDVEILDAASGASLGLVSISMAGGVPGQFQYAALAATVALTPGALYDVVTREAAGGDHWFDSDTVVTTRPEATVLNGVYSTATGWALNAAQNRMYGPVDFQFKTTTPGAAVAGSVPFLTALVPGTPRNDSDTWVGYKFTVGGDGMSVSSLGRFCISGNKESHPVKLVDAATGTDLPGAFASVQMDCASKNAFQYATLPLPIAPN